VLDGEVVCLDDDGRPNFRALLFRRAEPVLYAFDLLMLDGQDVRQKSLLVTCPPDPSAYSASPTALAYSIGVRFPSALCGRTSL